MRSSEIEIIEHKKSRRAKTYNIKPRNPVAHAAQTVAKGSGAHKDKKKAAKQGDHKHKKKDLEMAEDTNSLHNLQSELWDFYKDVHGMRPRHWTQEQWNDKEFLEKQYQGLVNIVNNMSPEERAEQGWGEGVAEEQYPFAGAKVGHKAGKAGQWRNDGPSKNRPARAGDLVGGA